MTPDDARDERADAPSDDRTDDVVTLRLKRVHLVGAILFVLGLLGGYLLFRLLDDDAVCRLPFTPSIGTGVDPTAAASSGRVDVSVAGRPALGPADAKVTVVEFLDYQCPFCKRHFDEVLPRLLDEYGGQIRYVVRNYPLTDIHPRAMEAALAAECAGREDKYFEYHDELFQNQENLERSDLIGYARQLGIPVEPFRECLNSGATTAAVQADVRDAASYGVTATPTFFINGERLVGAQSFEAFAAIIDRELGEG